ncbi:cbb3-type cytochrome oxidase assembly protein CcoS [Cognatilysobacter tabacisoli]|uniref:cbb3-type cytochrome oxidase assembly protein CcoS n=1 Tax=Cognatilysobacter tabacisoli TaxID=2315424 RepID=UPI000E6B264D
MNSLLLLVPLSLVLVVAAGWAFAWAVKRGQFDDLDTPALDILVDKEFVDDVLVDTARAGPASAGPDNPDAVASDADAAAERGDA